MSDVKLAQYGKHNHYDNEEALDRYDDVVGVALVWLVDMSTQPVDEKDTNWGAESLSAKKDAPAKAARGDRFDHKRCVKRHHRWGHYVGDDEVDRHADWFGSLLRVDVIFRWNTQNEQDEAGKSDYVNHEDELPDLNPISQVPKKNCRNGGQSMGKKQI